MEAFPLPLYVHPTLGVKGLAPPLAPSVQAVPLHFLLLLFTLVHM